MDWEFFLGMCGWLVCVVCYVWIGLFLGLGCWFWNLCCFLFGYWGRSVVWCCCFCFWWVVVWLWFCFCIMLFLVGFFGVCMGCSLWMMFLLCVCWLCVFIIFWMFLGFFSGNFMWDLGVSCFCWISILYFGVWCVCCWCLLCCWGCFCWVVVDRCCRCCNLYSWRIWW